MFGLSRIRRVVVRSSPKRHLFINTENTPNPNSLKFLPGKDILPEEYGSGISFESQQKREIKNSPLAAALFAIEGIKGVYFGKDYISVTKAGDFQWQMVKPQIFSAIFDFLADDKPLLLSAPAVSDTAILESDSEVIATIKELIEQKIRPYVQDDGGDIYFVKFDEENGLVHVRLAGSCVGCPSSSITLRNGVENMLKHYIPEVQGIVDATASVTDEDVADSGDSDTQRELKFRPETPSDVQK